MAEVVNLRRARKAKARAERAAEAAGNRVRHGRSRAQRDADAAEGERSERTHSGHRLGGRDGSAATPDPAGPPVPAGPGRPDHGDDR